MNKNSIDYLQRINFSQINHAESIGIKNLGRAASGLIIYQSSSSIIQTYVRKLNPVIYAEHKWLSDCAKEMLN
jgi:hypothetical protein